MSNKTPLQMIAPASLAAPPFLAASAASGDALSKACALTPLAFVWPRLGNANGRAPTDAGPLPALSEATLDHLAWHLHIDGWEYAKTRAERLWLLRNFHDWHRYKGTVYGHALYWRVLLGRELLGHAPRYNSYCGASLSQAEKAVFAAPHPEIRIYPFRNKGLGRGVFPKGPESTRQTVTGGWPAAIAHWTPGSGHSFVSVSDAASRVGQQLWWHDPVNGAEKRLNQVLSIASRELTVAMPGRMVGLALGGCISGHTVAHGAATRIYELALNAPGNSLSALSAQPLRPWSGDFAEIEQPGQAGSLVFLTNRWTGFPYQDRGGSHLSGYITGQSAATSGWRKIFPHVGSASDRIYKMVKLFDASRASASAKNSRAFIGGFRLGRMPAHHGELAVDATGAARPGQAFLGGCFVRHQVASISDAATRLAQIAAVGRLAARASDKIAISITNHQVIAASTAYLSRQAQTNGARISEDYLLGYIQ
ncbi:MAG: phage tail protein [Desulfobulbaceae bacterium]|nr:phage tail protein [Desulfobulbaceae bacterium]